MNKKRIYLVCGGRDFKDEERITSELNKHLIQSHKINDLNYQDAIILTGGAPGADTLADGWAQAVGIQRVIIPANWNGSGKAAGMQRNQLMLDLMQPDLVIAFPGGTGTAGMVRIARAHGTMVIEIN